MGVMKRLMNTVRGKTNAILNGIENPVQSLDLQIDDVTDKYGKLKTLSAHVIGNAKRIQLNLEATTKERNSIESKIETALNSGRDDLAKPLIERKIKLDAKITDFLAKSADADARVEVVKKDLKAYEDKLNDMKDYRTDAVSRYNTAKITTELNKVSNSKGESIDTTRIEDMIRKEEDYAYGLDTLNKESSDVSFNDALMSVSVDEELAKYKEKFNKKA